MRQPGDARPCFPESNPCVLVRSTVKSGSEILGRVLGTAWLLTALFSCRPASRCPTVLCKAHRQEPPKAVSRPAHITRARPRPAMWLQRPAGHLFLPTHERKPRSVALDPKGRIMAVGGSYGALEVIRVSDGRLLHKLGKGDELEEGLLVKFSPSGDILASAGHDLNRIRIWNPATGALTREMTASMQRITDMAVAGNLMLLVGGTDGKVEVFGLRTGTKLALLQTRYRQDLVHLDADQTGTWAAAGDVSGTVEIFNLKTRQQIGRVNASRRLTALALTPMGTQLAVALSNGVIRFHNLPFGDRDKRRTLRLRGKVQSMRFSPQGEALALAADDGSVGLYRFKDLKLVGSLPARGEPLVDLVMDQTGQVVAGVERERGIHVWWREGSVQVDEKKVKDNLRKRGTRRGPKIEPLAYPAVMVVPRTPFKIVNVAIDPRGHLVAASGHTEKVAVWDVETGKRLWYALQAGKGRRSRHGPGRPSGDAPMNIAFHPWKPYLFGCGQANQVYKIDARTGLNKHYTTGVKGHIKGLLYLHDGNSYMAYHANGWVEWLRYKGRRLATFRTLPKAYWIGVSSDGRYFVSVKGWDHISVHELPSGRILWEKPSGRLARYVVKALEFDSTADQLYTYHDTGFIRVYAARTGELLARHLMDFPPEVSMCAFHKSMKALACGLGRSVVLRHVPRGELLLNLKVPTGPAGRVEHLAYGMKGNSLMGQVGERGIVVFRFDKKGAPEPGPGPSVMRPPVVKPHPRSSIGKPKMPRLPKVRLPSPRRIRKEH